MGDEHHRAGIGGEKVLEPRNRVDVEMVGRLVEQQQLGLADQRPRQQDAPPPAAGEGLDDRFRRQVEPRDDPLDALLEAPAVAFLEVVLQAAEAFEPRRGRVAGDLDGGMVILGHERGEIAEPFRHHIEHRLRRRQRHVLHQPRDRMPGCRQTLPRSGCDRSIDNLQQRGFAGAVAADQRNPFARLDLERRVFEQWKVTVGDGDAVENDEGHRIIVPRARCLARGVSSQFPVDSSKGPQLRYWATRPEWHWKLGTGYWQVTRYK